MKDIYSNALKGADKFMDLFDIDSPKDAEKVFMGYRNKSYIETQEKMKQAPPDPSSLEYEKIGLNEYKASKFQSGDENIVSNGTIKQIKELLESMSMYKELVEFPVFLEDQYGNIWKLRNKA